MVDPNTADVQRIESPQAPLRWKRKFDGQELSAPVLQQLYAVAIYNPTTMATKHFEEWKDVPEVGADD
jgi:hypothetical protein